jgi:hypothetical protein
MNENDDKTVEEARMLGALAAGPEPPPGLEDAVVARLEAGGLVARPRRTARLGALAAAAGIALFFIGLSVGGRRAHAPAAPAAPPMPRYVLLLYDAPDEREMPAAEMAARVAEYRDWAIGLRRAGSDISGEKLAPQSLDLGDANAPAGPLPLGGYFVFSAKDPAAAAEVARSCPHVRHGGRVALRPIEET